MVIQAKLYYNARSRPVIRFACRNHLQRLQLSQYGYYEQYEWHSKFERWTVHLAGDSLIHSDLTNHDVYTLTFDVFRVEVIARIRNIIKMTLNFQLQ